MTPHSRGNQTGRPPPPPQSRCPKLRPAVQDCQAKLSTRFRIAIFPMTNKSGRAFQAKRIIGLPGNLEAASQRMHLNFAVCVAIEDGSHHGSARAGPGSIGFTYSPFPKTNFNFLPTLHLDEFHVGSIGEGWMCFNSTAYPFPIHSSKII